MNFLTEVVHLLFSQTTFQERTCVNARRDVALEVHQVAAVFLSACAEEVVEAHFINGCRRLEGSHVAAQLQIFFGCAQNGHDGVPANCRTDAAFQIQIARVFRFVFDGNRVYVVVSPCTCSYFHATFAGFRKHLFNQILSALNTFFTDDRFDRLLPVASFDRIHVILETF